MREEAVAPHLCTSSTAIARSSFSMPHYSAMRSEATTMHACDGPRTRLSRTYPPTVWISDPRKNVRGLLESDARSLHCCKSAQGDHHATSEQARHRSKESRCRSPGESCASADRHPQAFGRRL